MEDWATTNSGTSWKRRLPADVAAKLMPVHRSRNPLHRSDRLISRADALQQSVPDGRRCACAACRHPPNGRPSAASDTTTSITRWSHTTRMPMTAAGGLLRQSPCPGVEGTALLMVDDHIAAHLPGIPSSTTGNCSKPTLTTCSRRKRHRARWQRTTSVCRSRWSQQGAAPGYAAASPGLHRVASGA